MDAAIRKRLAAFAKGLSGPVGQIPLDRAIRRDIDLFVGLRNAGATWSQIAQALMAVGARRPDGGVISADHLRGAISRQVRRQSQLSTNEQEADSAPRTDIPARHTTARKKTVDTAQDGTIPTINAVVPPPDSSVRKTQPDAESVLAKLARAKRLREI